jgi:hypothetical protein
MSSFRSPDLLERRNNAATVKKVMLEKFRAARQEPAFEQQRLKRIAVNEARAFRTAEREAAKKVREVELAAQATRARCPLCSTQDRKKGSAARVLAASRVSNIGFCANSGHRIVGEQASGVTRIAPYWGHGQNSPSRISSKAYR